MTGEAVACTTEQNLLGEGLAGMLAATNCCGWTSLPGVSSATASPMTVSWCLSGYTVPGPSARLRRSRVTKGGSWPLVVAFST